MKPVIGISMNEINDAGSTLHHLPIDYVSSGYPKAVERSGGLPLLIPIGPPELAKLYINRIDKLILTGGQNISPELYGSKVPYKKNLNHIARDHFEYQLIKEAIAQKKPILGVCRGMQLVNVYFGGTLHSDLSLRVPERVKHMQAPVDRTIATHSVIFSPSSCLFDLYGSDLEVNSFHFQSIDQLGNTLKTVALSTDEVIEAIESDTMAHRILGIQWHPDFSYHIRELDQKLFDYFVQYF